MEFLYQGEDETRLPFQLLTGAEIMIMPIFFDYSKTDMGDFTELLKTLICKQAGIVFYHNRDQYSHDIFILAKLKHHGSFERLIWKADIPDHLTVPPLLDLYSKDEELSKNLLDTKLELLCWIVFSEQMDVNYIKDIDPTYVATILTIKRLIESGSLTKNEGDLLLLTVYRSTNKAVSTSSKCPSVLTSRGVRSAFLFIRFHIQIIRCIRTVGLPELYMVSYFIY